jgi:superfamily II DNA or RNA helicase
MEALLLESPELEDRRERAAGFIQNNLLLVKELIEDGAFEEVSEETIDGIENFETFDHQLDALGALWTARETEADRALLHMATGLGKTSVAVFDVIKFYEEFRAKNDREPRVLFACHKKEIIEQAAERFETFIPDLSQGFYADTKKDRDADITFATLQSVYASLDTFDPEEFDYIIYDEAHHSKADTFEQVVDHFEPAFQLALTATPDRLDQRDIRELFGEAVYSKNLAEALAEGLLVEPDYHIVFDDAVKEALDTDFSPTSVKELRKLLDVWPRNEQIAENIKAEMEKLGLELGKIKTIIFCQDIMHAEDMAWLLDGEAYHSDLPKAKRKEILQRFRGGDLQTTCVRDMFNEGIDIPDAELLVFLRSTVSETIFEQQLGRGLRKHEDKEKVTVLDFAANIERILMIRELAESIEGYTISATEGSSVVRDGVEEGAESTVQFISKNFDFDKLSVDLLDKYSAFTFDSAPEGYTSVNAFSEEVGAGKRTIVELIEENDIETEQHNFFGSIGLSLSPAAHERLRQIINEREGLPPPGYESFNVVAKNLGAGIGIRAVSILVEDYEIPTEKYRYGQRATEGLSPEAQDQLKRLIEDLGLRSEEHVSMPAFAKVLGISPQSVEKMMVEHDIRGETYTLGNKTFTRLGPQAQERLKEVRDALLPPAPDDYVTLNSFVKEFRTATETIMRLADKHHIEIGKHRFQGKTALSLSSETQKQLAQLLRAKRKK